MRASPAASTVVAQPDHLARMRDRTLVGRAHGERVFFQHAAQRRHLAARGITAIALSPGWVRTDMGGAEAAIDPETSVTGMRRVIAEAVQGKDRRLAVFERLRHADFPGGRLLRRPALMAGMCAFRLRDWLPG